MFVEIVTVGARAVVVEKNGIGLSLQGVRKKLGVRLLFDFDAGRSVLARFQDATKCMTDLRFDHGKP